jgi:hypothetical protein
MSNRKLRIAWPVAWGIACVLLIVLWVRSYWRAYHLESTDAAVIVAADYGEIHVSLDLPAILDGEEDGGWSIYGTPPLFDSFEGFPRGKPSPPHLDFQFNSIRDLYFRAPGWFLSLSTVVLAALPWLPRRFSLRTLLIATTLVAAGLGLIVYAAR